MVIERRRGKLRHAGSDQRVAPEVASKSGRIRKGEALGFDVVGGVPVVDQRLAAWTKHAIRWLVGFIQVHAQWVASQQWSKWLTTRSPVNASQLPSAKCPLREPRAHFGCGYFPGEVGNKGLAHIEVRRAPSC